MDSFLRWRSSRTRMNNTFPLSSILPFCLLEQRSFSRARVWLMISIVGSYHSCLLFTSPRPIPSRINPGCDISLGWKTQSVNVSIHFLQLHGPITVRSIHRNVAHSGTRCVEGRFTIYRHRRDIQPLELAVWSSGAYARQKTR